MRSLLTTGKRKDFALREMRESNVSHTQRQTQKQRRHYNKHGYTNIIIHDPVVPLDIVGMFSPMRTRVHFNASARAPRGNRAINYFMQKGPGASLMG